MDIYIKYTKFSTEDFIWDPHFRQWVLDPDIDTDIFWNEWISKHPHKQAEVTAAKQIIKSVKVKNTPISDYEIILAVSSVLNQTSADKEPPAKEKKDRNLWIFSGSKKYFSLAACFFLLITGSVFYFEKESDSSSEYNQLVKSSKEKLTEKANNVPERSVINLQDGSKVILNKNARISFPESFDGLTKREVYLTGEATFEVAKNPQKPFFVYANGMIVKVLGTSFKIRSYYDEKNSTIEVKSGVVAAYSLEDESYEHDLNGQKLNYLLLTRNQEASYSNDGRTVRLSVVEKPVAINDRIFDYTFSDTPIKRIFENIEDGYGIEILFDEKSLKNRTFTGDLRQVSMYDKLNIICKVINTRYEVIDGKIIVYSN